MRDWRQPKKIATFVDDCVSICGERHRELIDDFVRWIAARPWCGTDIQVILILRLLIEMIERLDMPTWNQGAINWTQTDGTNPVIQVGNNARDSATPVYSWRNLLPGESFLDACKQYADSFDFAANGSVLASCVAQEWSADGRRLIQERQFGFGVGDPVLFTEDES